MPNHLKNENSPYLLQHAHNPVDWYPWCDEAIKRARQEDKPIFLSIGYAACHWCHVMERESFEDEATATIMNANFISIKVDREERPDLDSIYMNATQAMTGSGGWPMSVFLTPNLEPFYAGTYFPPTSRYNLPGFKDLLISIARAWREDRESCCGWATRSGIIWHNPWQLPASSNRTALPNKFSKKSPAVCWIHTIGNMVAGEKPQNFPSQWRSNFYSIAVCKIFPEKKSRVKHA